MLAYQRLVRAAQRMIYRQTNTLAKQMKSLGSVCNAQ